MVIKKNDENEKESLTGTEIGVILILILVFCSCFSSTDYVNDNRIECDHNHRYYRKCNFITMTDKWGDQYDKYNCNYWKISGDIND